MLIVCEGLSSYSAQNGKLLVILSQEVTQFDMFKRSMGCCGKKRLPTDRRKYLYNPRHAGDLDQGSGSRDEKCYHSRFRSAGQIETASW